MLNNWNGMGRLTADPELSSTTGGQAYVRFTLAIDRDYKDRDSGERAADFIPVTAWRHTATFVNRYFRKGQLACVTGRIQTRSWTDADGKRQYGWEVLADSVYFAGNKSDGGGAAEPEHKEPVFTPMDDDDGELPF